MIFESARARYESFTRDDSRIVYRRNCICRMAYGAATTSSLATPKPPNRCSHICSPPGKSSHSKPDCFNPLSSAMPPIFHEDREKGDAFPAVPDSSEREQSPFVYLETVRLLCLPVRIHNKTHLRESNSCRISTHHRMRAWCSRFPTVH